MDLIHGIGHGETGQEVAFFQEHRHFIGIHYVENLKDHNCLVLGEKLEIEALRISQQRSGREAIVLLCTEPKIANFAMILAAKKHLVPLAMETEFGKPQQTFQKCQEVWSRGVVPLHRSQAAGAGAQRIGARQFEKKKKSGCFLSANSKQASFAVTRR